jgi:uncharacterized protein YcfL
MNKYLIVLAFLLLSACSHTTSKAVKKRERQLASGQGLSEIELYIKNELQEITSKFSKSKNVDVDVSNSPTAIEYMVYYQNKDKKSLETFSGFRLRAMKTLFNEIYLESQQQDNDDKFPEHPKKIIIRFYGDEE